MPAGEALYQSDVSGTHAMVAHLQAQLHDMACQNWQMQQQLATKDAELVSRGQEAQGLNQLVEWWEGQVCVQLSMQYCCSIRGTVAALWYCCSIVVLLQYISLEGGEASQLSRGSGQAEMACKVSQPST